MQKLILSFPLLLLLFCGGAKAEMQCTSDAENYNVSLSNVFVPSHSNPGDIVAVESHSVNVTCRGSGNYQQISEVSNGGWSSSGLTANVEGLTCPVIDQGMTISDKGLGIVWTNYNSATGTRACVSGIFNGMGVNPMRRGLLSNGTTTLTDVFYLIRTEQPLQYGGSAQINQLINVDEADADRISRGHLYQIRFSGSINVEAGGCDIASRTDVNMGTVSTSTFHGPGSTGPVVPFTVALSNCEGSAASVLMRIEPGDGFADAANSVIALSQQEDSASGVGIQLLANGQKIDPNGVKIPFQQGTILLPFSASYYQIADRVQAGRADSVVVFYTVYE